MNTDTVSRRLAAIVIADVVGYSRHMERDDTGTFARSRDFGCGEKGAAAQANLTLRSAALDIEHHQAHRGFRQHDDLQRDCSGACCGSPRGVTRHGLSADEVYTRILIGYRQLHANIRTGARYSAGDTG